MTDEINPSELGAFTNNLPNKEGLKKLCDKVNNASGGVEYTAGDNIQISAENVISATDTKYTAGTNVEISEQNVISATDTKYTAGTGITISEQNVISASGGGGSEEWKLPQTQSLTEIIGKDGSSNIKALKDFVIVSNATGNVLVRGFKNMQYTLKILQGDVQSVWTPVSSDFTKFYSAYYYLKVEPNTESKFFIDCKQVFSATVDNNVVTFSKQANETDKTSYIGVNYIILVKD